MGSVYNKAQRISAASTKCATLWAQDAAAIDDTATCLMLRLIAYSASNPHLCSQIPG